MGGSELATLERDLEETLAGRLQLASLDQGSPDFRRILVGGDDRIEICVLAAGERTPSGLGLVIELGGLLESSPFSSLKAPGRLIIPAPSVFRVHFMSPA